MVGEKTVANPQLIKGTKVSAIFHYCGGHFDDDVSMVGVYANQKDAVNRGLEFTDFDDKEIEKKQKTIAQTVLNGSLFYDEEDSFWGVAIETVVLDEDADCGMVGLHQRAYGCWMSPEVLCYDE